MPTERGVSQSRAADALALAALLWGALLVAGIAGRPLATDDTWWHLKLGEVYAAQGPHVAQDPLLHTAPDQPTVPHEWLFQVGLYGVEQALGFAGLRVLHVALVVAILLGVYGSLRRVAPSTAAAAAATLAWIALAWYRLIQLRPELVSLLALLWLTRSVLLRSAPVGPRRGAAALVLLVAWANFHSLFAVGLALLLAAVVGSLAERHGLGAPGDPSAGPRARELGLLLALGSLVTALNPQGFAQHATFLTESASGDIWLLQDDFRAWLPWHLEEPSPALTRLAWTTAGVLLAAWMLVTAGRAWRLLRERSEAARIAADPTGTALAAAAWIAMLVAVRFHWLAFLPLQSLLRWLPGGRAASWAAALLCLALAAALPGAVGLGALRNELAFEPQGYWRSPYLRSRYCADTADFLAEAGLEGRLFHPFNLGGYLGYRLAPRLRTFIDGRLDHVPSGVLDDYREIRQAIRMSDEARFLPLLDAYRIDVFVGTHFHDNRYGEGTWTDHLRRQPEWLPIFASQECSAYLRRGPRNRANLARVAATYAKLGIGFSDEFGPDMGQALRRQRAWTDANRITPPHYDALETLQRSGTPEQQEAALDALARGLWRIGAFREQVALDRVLANRDLDALESRRRLADALLQLGDLEAARGIASKLARRAPDYSDARALLRTARARSAH